MSLRPYNRSRTARGEKSITHGFKCEVDWSDEHGISENQEKRSQQPSLRKEGESGMGEEVG